MVLCKNKYDDYLVRDINSPIPQFTNPQFLFIKISICLLFSLDWNYPTFSKSWGGINMHMYHSIIKKHNTKFRKNIIRGLVKINWWIDVTNKIILTPDFGYWCKRYCNTGLKWSGARGVCKKPENYKRVMSRLWKFLYYYFLTERRLAVWLQSKPQVRLCNKDYSKGWF